MNMSTAGYVLEVFEALPRLIDKAGVKDFIQTVIDRFESMTNQDRGPTKAEWAELRDRMKALKEGR